MLHFDGNLMHTKSIHMSPFFLTAASQLRAVTITRSCVAVTIVETDDANCFYCDGLTFVSPDAVVAVHKTIDYLYTGWKPRPTKVVYLNSPIRCCEIPTIIVQ